MLSLIEKNKDKLIEKIGIEKFNTLSKPTLYEHLYLILGQEDEKYKIHLKKRRESQKKCNKIRFQNDLEYRKKCFNSLTNYLNKKSIQV